MGYESPTTETLPEFEKELKRPIDYVLASAKKRPDPLEFVDNSRLGYTEAEIRKDLDAVDRIKKKFVEGGKRGEALEIIAIENGEEFEWFGQNARMDRTSEYDDIFKGVDGILWFEVENFPYRIALAIDASTRAELTKKQLSENENKGSGKVKSIKEKIERNLEKINDPKISSVKYYRSRDGKEVDQTLIVPIVIGLEGENTDKLIILFGKIAELRQKSKLSVAEAAELSRLTEEAKNHPAQVIFLKQALAQLLEYSEKLQNEKGFKLFYRNAVAGLENMVGKILREKEHISAGELENDGVYRKIKETLEKL